MSVDLLLLIAVFSLVRVYLVLGHPSEESYHCSLANFIRQKKLHLNGSNVIFIPKGRLSNPILYHYIVSLMPKFFAQSSGLRIVNCLFDLMAITLFYFFIRSTLTFEHLNIFGRQVEIAFVVVLWLVLSPALTPLNSRTRGGGARTLGFLFSTAYFLGLYTFWSTNNFWLLPLCILPLFLNLFSSQFGNQVNIFGSIVLFFILRELNLLIPLIIFTVMSCSLGKDLRAFFLCKIQAHFRFYTSIFAGTIVDDRKKNPFNLPFRKWKFQRTKVRQFLYLSPFYFLPAIYLVNILSAVFFFNISDTSSPFVMFSLSLNLALCLVAFATFWYPLSVFGQSERYMEYATPFAIIGLISQIENVEILASLFSFQVFILIFNLYLLNKPSKIQDGVSGNDSETKANDESTIEQIQKFVMLVYPYKRTFDFFYLANEDKKFFLPLINQNSEPNWHKNYDLFDGYKNYKHQWDLWKKKYSITHLLVCKKHINISLDSFSQLNQVYESEEIAIFKL